MNKLVLTWLVCLLTVSLSVDSKPTNAVTLTGSSYNTYQDDDWKHGDKHEDKWKHEEKGKDGAPVPFESSPAVGAMLLVGWGFVSMKRKNKSKSKTKKVVL